MSIQVGDRIPEATLRTMTAEGPQEIPSSDYFAGRRVVLFSVPGAFTPTCSARHLPGFIELADEVFAHGVDAIGCVAVNDVFVMGAWGRSAGADRIDMLADGNGEFAAALGLELDSRAFGMGMRSQRFALVAEDGVVTKLFVEGPGEFRVSSAEHVLANL
jgi:peroxiredoxin